MFRYLAQFGHFLGRPRVEKAEEKGELCLEVERIKGCIKKQLNLNKCSRTSVMIMFYSKCLHSTKYYLPLPLTFDLVNNY